MKGIMKKAVFLAAAGMTALALSRMFSRQQWKADRTYFHAQSETHPSIWGFWHLRNMWITSGR